MKTLRGTPTIDTSALDGLRLIFNCAIACYHALMWKVSFLTNHHENPAFQNLSNSNLIYILSNQGMSWVDLFFLLNSCLLVYHLLPRLEDSNSKDGVWKVIFEFYYKKWCSIVPIYTTSTLLVWLISISIHSSSGSNIYASHIGLVNGFVGGCPDRIWKNVLLINNWGPDIGCGGINWTIAPTILCYIIAPLLIIQCSPRNKNFRRRFLALALALFIGGLCINIYFSVANNIQYPMCTYPSFWKQGVSHFYVYASQYYIRSLPRIPVFVVGALCGLFLRTPAAITWVSSYRSLLGLVAVILLLLLYIHMCTWHSVYPTQPWSQLS